MYPTWFKDKFDRLLGTKEVMTSSKATPKVSIIMNCFNGEASS